jgi:integrase
MSAVPPTLIQRKIPELRHHKNSGQAYARFDGKFFYFGKWDDPKTAQNYRQTIAEWLLGHSRKLTNPGDLTVLELIDRYIVYAQSYYVDDEGKTNTEFHNVRIAARVLKNLYGHTLAAAFGPLALRAVREKMLEKGWCRRNINHNVGRVKRMFRWATENELVPGTVYHALQAVAGLKRGRTLARESDAVRPAPHNLIEAVKPYVSRQVWAMIELQRYTGARGGEICIMRPCDIDRSSEVWLYQPGKHKTAHYGYQRTIYIGPRAQEVLAPFLLRPPQQYCFSPKEAMDDSRQEANQARKTPLSCGNRPGTNRKAIPRKTPLDHYTPGSYSRAVTYALGHAFPPPGELNKQDGETVRQWQARLTPEQNAQITKWHKQHHWHPHQLRHNAATELRKEFGLEAARIILGHRSAAITEVYAEEDKQKAIEAIAKAG